MLVCSYQIAASGSWDHPLLVCIGEHCIVTCELGEKGSVVFECTISSASDFKQEDEVIQLFFGCVCYLPEASGFVGHCNVISEEQFCSQIICWDSNLPSWSHELTCIYTLLSHSHQHCMHIVTNTHLHL